ncbi:MAG: SIS domain-containing protein [Phycisphaerae bacterium]
MVRQTLTRCLRAGIEAKEAFLKGNGGQFDAVQRLVRAIVKAFSGKRPKGKLVIFGNGGSAADAQHVAGEMVCRFLKDRPALPAVALTTDTSVLTAVGNDMSFDDVFARQVDAIVNKGDVVVGMSTSGNSPNVIKALQAAKARGALTAAFTGRGGKLGAKNSPADIRIRVPSDSTPRIQEVHIAVWHAICQAVEQEVFGRRR